MINWKYDTTGNVTFGRKWWIINQKKITCSCGKTFYKWRFKFYALMLIKGAIRVYCPYCGRQQRYILIAHHVSDQDKKTKEYNKELVTFRKTDFICKNIKRGFLK